MKRILSVLLILALLLGTAFAQIPLFTCEDVEPTQTAGVEDIDIYVDETGAVHMVHMTGTGAELRYCTGTSGNFSCETIGPAGNDSDTPRIMGGPAGNLHIAYYSGNTLRYCTGTSGNWGCEDVETGKGYPNLFIDSTGKPHITHYSNSFHTRYCVKNSGFFYCEDLYSMYVGGMDSSLFVEDDGTVHISDRVGQAGWEVGLYYCKGRYRNWSCSIIESITESFGHTSIFLDPENKTHITYGVAGTTHDMRYCLGTDGGWSCEAVESSGMVGAYTDSFFDESGTGYISHVDIASPRTLRYCTGTYGNWSCGGVEETKGDTAVSLGADKNAHIIHIGTNSNLRYCITSAPDWECTGSVPANSVLCPGDGTGLAEDTPRALKESCSSPEGSEPKCEHICDSSYEYSGGACVPVPVCTGPVPSNSTLCAGDDTGLSSDTPRVPVGACSSPGGSEPKCEYVCVPGFVPGGADCVEQVLNSIEEFKGIFEGGEVPAAIRCAFDETAAITMVASDGSNVPLRESTVSCPEAGAAIRIVPDPPIEMEGTYIITASIPEPCEPGGCQKEIWLVFTGSTTLAASIPDANTLAAVLVALCASLMIAGAMRKRVK